MVTAQIQAARSARNQQQRGAPIDSGAEKIPQQSAKGLSYGLNSVLQKQNMSGAPPEVNAAKPNQTGLPDNLKTGMENLSGMNLDRVRVHYNSPKPASMQALAYAQGNNIHLASGQEKHLPHELGHVVQQMQGKVQANTSIGGTAVNDNPDLEREADSLGQQALQMKTSAPDATRLSETKASQSADNTEGVAQMMMSSRYFQQSTVAIRNNNQDIVESGLLNEIDQFIKDYKAIKGDKWLTRQQTLGILEDLLYKFITKNSFYMSRHPAYRLALNTFLNLMTEIGEEHERVITHMTADHRNELYFKDDLTPPERRQALSLWNQIKGGNGRIKVLDYDYFRYRLTGEKVRMEAFRNKMLAAFAKILSTRVGQNLITQLLNQRREVKVVPITPAMRQGRQFLGQSIDRVRREQGTPVPENVNGQDHGGNSPGITAVDLPDVRYRSNLPRQQADIAFQRDLGTGYLREVGMSRNALDLYGHPVAHDPRDVGSDALVGIDPQINNATAFALNANMDLLPTPVFLTLAHELVHAKHIVTGASKGGIVGDLHYGNAEERQTIAESDTSENALRAEHNLGLRFGHVGALRQDIDQLLMQNIPMRRDHQRFGLPPP